MEYQRFGNMLVVRLNRGEEIVEQLKQVATNEKIKLAQVNGIGATSSFVVGCYSFEEQVYHQNEYEGEYEIISLQGNISTMNDETYLHIHMACGDMKGNVVGGHLNRCVVSITCELFINIVDGQIDRMKDPITGINILKFIDTAKFGYDDETIIERLNVGDRVKVRLLNYPSFGKVSEDYGTVTKIINGEWMQINEETMDQVYMIMVACDNTGNQAIAFNPKNVKKA